MNTNAPLDVASNRSARKYTRREQVRRVLWMLAWPFFRFSLRPFFGWRRFLLRLFGATVGKDVHVYPSTVIYFPWNLTVGDGTAIGEDALVYNLGPVTLGERVTVSHRAHLCAGTHDYKKPDLPLQKPPVVVESDAWVCADTLVGPGVTVGEGAVVGAGTVAMRDVPAWTVVAGNPAEFIKERSLEGS